MAKSKKVKQARKAKNVANSKKRSKIQIENTRVLNVIKAERTLEVK